ncbi:MAG TPA: tannase/feruloyl esterase family alpha/beta hydrolase [Stellaceae bacterium]|nr:tannase/feruloyl esterase family alpha/beta hydrolase [Stellaceae bacterium]
MAATTTPKVTCASLTSLALPNAQIISATEVTTFTPNYCNVIGVIDKRVSSQDPDHFTYGIGFELNLPDSWIGRFEMQGGGGTDGSVRSPGGNAGIELSQGWAVAADDGGHEDSPSNPFGWSDDDANAGGSAHFGIDEQARIDYGYNGIFQTTTISKLIIAHYYGEAAAYAYLAGCSNGGRDGMVASQRFPDLFDGVISGNPGFDLPRAGLTEAWNEQALAPLATRTDVNGQPYIPDTFPPQDLEVASAAILGACDGLDGLVDGIIDNFPACTDKRVFPALDAFTCSATGAHGNTQHGGSCLTAAQVAALKKLFAGPENSKGKHLYSRWYWDAGIWDPPTAGGLGFAGWNIGTIQTTGTLSNNAFNLTLGAGAVPMIFHNPPVVTPVAGPAGQEAFMFHYNFDTDAPTIFASAPGYPESPMEFMTGVSLDMQPFKAHHGKLIIYDSVNDGIFSGADIVHWYDAMNDFMGGDAQRFARLFMVPNMAHCGGGPATNNFSANILTAITNWVENGVAPDRIIAGNGNTSSPFPTGGLFDPRVAANFPTGGTRPLCPYPQQSRYVGSGATNNAANFVCVKPRPADERDHDKDDFFFGGRFDDHFADFDGGDRGHDYRD